jgi:hypothetical protein
VHEPRQKPVDGPTAVRAIEEGKVDLVINIPVGYDDQGRPDGYLIRRRAVDAGLPLLTDLQLARAVIEALRHRKRTDLETRSYDEYLRDACRALNRALIVTQRPRPVTLALAGRTSSEVWGAIQLPDSRGSLDPRAIRPSTPTCFRSRALPVRGRAGRSSQIASGGMGHRLARRSERGHACWR